MKPTIKIHGWWWKRLFPKYRKINRHMDGLVAYIYEKEAENIGKKMAEGLMKGDYLDPTPDRGWFNNK